MRSLCVAAALALATVPSVALDWPVANRVLTGTFGESRGDHFHLGIDLGGGEQEVFPMLPGEVVFRYEENADWTSLPRGVGSFVVVRHADDILSMYCHLKRDVARPARTTAVAREPLGVTGDTGASEGTHLHVMLYDGQIGAFVNPLPLLPALRDREPPVIRSIVLRQGDRVLDLLPDATVAAGATDVLVETWDAREDVSYLWPMAPYVARLALNGKEVARVTFDAVEQREGRLVLRGTSLGVAQVHARDRLLRLGSVELRGGESHLLVTVRDFAGNESQRELFFSVRQ